MGSIDINVIEEVPPQTDSEESAVVMYKALSLMG